MGTLMILLVMFLLLLFKGFFSGSEIAVVSADKIQMRHKARMGNRGARLLLKMYNKPDKLLTTTLVGTNLATVGLATLGTLLMIEHFGEKGDLLAFLIFTPLFLVFGEIVPKSVYQQKAESMVPVIIYPLKAASLLFLPITFLFSIVARGAARLMGAGKASQSVFITREQLRSVLEMTERRSGIASFTRGSIRRAIRFSHIQAGDVMTPLKEMPLFKMDDTPEKLFSMVRDSGYRSVAVYEGNTANITGVISIAPWEIMKHRGDNPSVDNLLETPFFAPPQQTLDQLLPELRTRRDQVAVIVDEFGSAVGMVSLEDILGVVVGDVKPGHRFEKHSYRRERNFEIIEDGIYLLDARLPISEINDVIGLNLPSRDYRTIGGMLMALLRHVPREGEYITDSGYRFTVVEATPKSVTRIRAEPE